LAAFAFVEGAASPAIEGTAQKSQDNATTAISEKETTQDSRLHEAKISSSDFT